MRARLCFRQAALGAGRLFLVLALIGGDWSLRAQDVAGMAAPTPAALLNVGGEVPTVLHLTADDLAKLPRTDVHVPDRDGREVIFAGVSLAEILRGAGLKFDPAAMPAKGAVASYILVEAADGYKAVCAWGEIDPTLSGRVVLLADRRDGQPLSPAEGPLRLIVPGDKRPARWVRQVSAISVHKG